METGYLLRVEPTDILEKGTRLFSPKTWTSLFLYKGLEEYQKENYTSAMQLLDVARKGMELILQEKSHG
jgi:hypothetical protein